MLYQHQHEGRDNIYLDYYCIPVPNRTWHRKDTQALAGVAQRTECPVNRKVAVLVPSQGTHPGCRPGPQLEVCERQPINVYLSPSPSLLN